MGNVNASESVKAHVRWTWEALDGATEREIAQQAVAAIFRVAEGWLEIVALEARLGLVDREAFIEADQPANPFQLLLEAGRDGVRVTPMYRTAEAQVAKLDEVAAQAWIAEMLEEAMDERYEASVRELLVAGQRVKISDGGRVLTLASSAGEVEIGTTDGWVSAPASPPGIPDPVALRIANEGGALRMILEVFWSIWTGEHDIAAAVQRAAASLERQGWQRA